MGLLDRMMYSSPQEIPRNWEMTLLDSKLIAARNKSLQITFDTQPIGQIENHSPINQKGKRPLEAVDADVSEAMEKPFPKRQG